MGNPLVRSQGYGAPQRGGNLRQQLQQLEQQPPLVQLRELHGIVAQLAEERQDAEPASPVSFWEWFCAKYPPDYFLYNQQHYFTSIKSTSTSTTTTGPILVQTPLFCFAFRSKAVIHSSGAAPTVPYRIGIGQLSANDWTFGQWFSEAITGDSRGAGGPYEYTFYWPREVPASTQLTATVDATFTGQVALDVDVGIVGLEPRKRDVPLVNVMGEGSR